MPKYLLYDGGYGVAVARELVELSVRVRLPVATHEILRSEATIKFQCPERSEGQMFFI